MEKEKAVKNVLVVLGNGEEGKIIEGPGSLGICTVLITGTNCVRCFHYNEIKEYKN